MIELIPAIDIISGKCVRLYQGDYNQKKEYSSNPLEVAMAFEQAGIKRLHLVDLDGAREKKPVNLDVLKKIAKNTTLKIDYGGGISSTAAIEQALSCGAKQVTAGSIAVRQPELMDQWMLQFGSKQLILGADARDGKIAVSGWQEETSWPVMEFIELFYKKGFRYLISTDIKRDGVLNGPAVELYSEIKSLFPEMYVIASGGVSNISDIELLAKNNIDGVIFGKAFYEGHITLDQLKDFLC